MKFIILDCGSSMGVPRSDGSFGKCDPKNKKNHRSRCSALIQTKNETVLIDTSPDLRHQLIKNKITNIKKGQYTEPIKIPGGFLILKVNDIKVNVEKLDKIKELEKRIREEKNQQLNQYSLIYFNKVKKDTKINEL